MTDPPRRGRDRPLENVKTDHIHWNILMDHATQTLAASDTARGLYTIRWVNPGGGWLLFHNGKYLTCFRNIIRLNQAAHLHLQYGHLPSQEVL